MTETPQYQVLARKYRSKSFDDLIGQAPMVRTLTNAFESGRIAHAFIMTGVRGVGKTSTARIIAKGLNCIGPDGKRQTPTTEPCGECAMCQAIQEGRHVDVLELDAASNTQVDKMREVLAGVPYRPAEARYKVYIFDEVHMLSTSAFNALLKTLEEPPAHVKFIFATTEIRKVPVTVLSRCQRFDLRRVEPETMLTHLRFVSEAEKAVIDDDALRLIVRAAEGSVRDALSLLDQAIAMGAGEANVENIRAMMGLADRARVLDLFDAVMVGDVSTALDILGGLFMDGADPAAVIRDLAETTHLVSVMKVAPEHEEGLSPDERDRARGHAAKLSLPVLARMWQMLLKLAAEIELAPNRMMGAEMAIIRLCHVADQPPPGELLAKLQNMGITAPAKSETGATSTENNAPRAEMPRAKVVNGGADGDALVRYTRFDDVIELIRARRDLGLLIDVETHIRLVEYRAGRITFEAGPRAPRDLATTLKRKLDMWTGASWGISLVPSGGAPSIVEMRQAEERKAHDEVLEEPLIRSVMARFPGAEIANIRTFAAAKGEGDILEAVDDEDGDDFDAIDIEDMG